MPASLTNKKGKKSYKQGSLFVVSAPSGAGKSTLCGMLIKNLDKLKISVSYTTRARRKGERNNVHYSFISENKFREMIGRQEFAEWAMVHRNLYGTSIKRIKELNSKGYDIILDIDVQGARQIRRTIEEAIFIFILPPSMSVLKKRLTGRSTDSKEQVRLRLDAAKEEMSGYDDYDYIVINDDLDRAYDDLKSIVISHRLKAEKVNNKNIEKLLK